MTGPQKSLLLKINPVNGRFSESAVETRVLHSLQKMGLVSQPSPWKFYLTDAGRAVVAEAAALNPEAQP
jgi:ribosomal protein S19E (S16A)